MFSAFRAAIAFAALIVVSQVTSLNARAQTATQNAEVKTQFPVETIDAKVPVEAVAKFMEVWEDGNTTVTLLKGGADSLSLAAVRQGDVEMRAESLVIIDTQTENGHNVQVYGEDRVRFRSRGQQRNSEAHSIVLRALQPADIRASYPGKTNTQPTHMMRKALAHFDPSRSAAVTPVSLQAEPNLFIPPQLQNAPAQDAGATRRIQIYPRSTEPLRFESGPSRDTIPKEQVYIITGGVKVVVEGAMSDMGGGIMQPGVLDLSADRVVVWVQSDGGPELDMNQIFEQPTSAKFQVYLEGNILVRQGQNTVNASHGFVDVSNDRALLMNADLRAELPQTGGQVRVRAEKLRQISGNRFYAQNAWTTTSPYGKPGYRLQSQNISVAPGPISPFTELDPATGFTEERPRTTVDSSGKFAVHCW